MVLPRLMIRKCRKAMFRWKIADSTDQSLSGAQLLMHSLILRRLLLREVFPPKASDEKYVGLLLPPSNGAVVVNAAVTLAGRVACNVTPSARTATFTGPFFAPRRGSSRSTSPSRTSAQSRNRDALRESV